MVENKYPEYVTTDSDLWNSADEAYFYVVKNKAKPLTSIITPIIEQALESGLLREATEEEIKEYELDQDIEKRIREGRFNIGKTRAETIEIYLKWKEAFEKNNTTYKNPQKITKPVINSVPKPIDDNDKKEKNLPSTTTQTPLNTTTTKTLTPTENALKQKASIRSDNM